jgi:hypothetical protein
MEWVERLASLVTTLAIVSFATYAAALVRMPTDRRPTIRPIDRFGRPLADQENPD